MPGKKSESEIRKMVDAHAKGKGVKRVGTETAKAMQEPHAESAPRLITKREAGVHEEGEGPRQLPREGVFKAWLRHGPKGMFGGTEPGLLTAREGRVSFATRQETVFEADRSEIRVNWPWWEFGGGVHLTVSGKTYRLSLIEPSEGPSD